MMTEEEKQALYRKHHLTLYRLLGGVLFCVYFLVRITNFKYPETIAPIQQHLLGAALGLLFMLIIWMYVLQKYLAIKIGGNVKALFSLKLLEKYETYRSEVKLGKTIYVKVLSFVLAGVLIVELTFWVLP
jgi:hypothetical protein